MDSALTLLTLSAGMLLSLSFAALLEELFFGGLFRLFFASRRAQPAPVKTNPEPKR
jgi:hypothetical protein